MQRSHFGDIGLHADIGGMATWLGDIGLPAVAFGLYSNLRNEKEYDRQERGSISTRLRTRSQTQASRSINIDRDVRRFGLSSCVKPEDRKTVAQNFGAKMRSNLALAALLAIYILDTANSRKTYPPPRINPNCECGKSGDGIANRIIGGIVTTPHIYPWIVAIFLKKALHCGGALINDRYVLTAGHCVKWADHSRLEVGLGMHDIKNPSVGYIAPIDRVILHQHFESDYIHDTNDISLIRLKYPVTYSETVSPVCLPVKGSDYTGHKVIVTGWGRVTSNGGPARYLRRATLRVMPWPICRNVSFGDHITESMMCAYADMTDACQGDSGGPLLYERRDGKHETVGIVSWGLGCAQPRSPGVYVKNTDYLNWIKFHTSDAIYCIDRNRS